MRFGGFSIDLRLDKLHQMYYIGISTQVEGKASYCVHTAKKVGSIPTPAMVEDIHEEPYDERDTNMVSKTSFVRLLGRTQFWFR